MRINTNLFFAQASVAHAALCSVVADGGLSKEKSMGLYLLAKEIESLFPQLKDWGADYVRWW